MMISAPLSKKLGTRSKDMWSMSEGKSYVEC